MILRFIFYLAGLSAIAACQHPMATRPPALSAYFRTLPLGDTLHLEISTDTILGALIPNSLFLKEVPASLLQEADYLTDPEQTQVYGRQQFPLNDSLTAYRVEIRQFWFQHQMLLLYNRQKKAFTGHLMVAEWYGGESGQILSGSWLLDVDGDGNKDLVRRQIEHYTEIDGEEIMEHVTPSATLLLWKNGRFTETPLADTAAFIQQYPIRSFW